MSKWMIKSEPEAYSFDKLVADGKTAWTGVRNYTARNNLAAMKPDDLCLFYHSVGPKEIVGVAKVLATAYPDPTAPADEANKAWVCVDVGPVERFAHPVTLAHVKAHPVLREMQLVKQSRLSVCPVTDEEWNVVATLAHTGDFGALGRATSPAKPTSAKKAATKRKTKASSKPAAKAATKKAGRGKRR